MLVCPHCHVELTRTADTLACPSCARVYPIEHDIADFSGGHYYDHFTPGDELSDAHEVGLANEEPGTRTRIESFYAPLLRRESDVTRVLDCGTGNGLAVDLLCERGFDAWGADLSALRKWQWRTRVRRDRLVVSDAARMPFSDGFFDAVICSGLLEHVGVEESGVPAYEVRPLPNRDELRVEVLRELLRVTKRGGVLYLDFPNGAFPIDFWHGTVPGGARVHSLREGFLPTVREVRTLIARAGGATSIEAISPFRRLQFRQTGRHWYGRLLALPMSVLLRSMQYRPLRFLAGSPLNPFLVIRIVRG